MEPKAPSLFFLQKPVRASKRFVLHSYFSFIYRTFREPGRKREENEYGGIVFGGGEPLLNSRYIRNVIELLPDDIPIWVETSLNVRWEDIEIVSLERELMAANMYLKQMQRTVEILQAQMNGMSEILHELQEA